ncbi:hypothetical protein K469DRAFT_726693 [Zopfia rhizophila CBS 207.26]|uniref:Fungal N-terminal domain-containing protein n=1 Tax=Zopfia rhizophila CBS 207.26 TaxID=1314779 RepID=A0A6A6E1A5_9PEZI|nr:hypothetical protein K469DRAFT_726693 [Zopfia rhizophila CBS 207.26]
MSFGFSPSDIVLFIGFATKVVKALKDEGGSRSEYQLAERQCQDLLAVMEDIKRLDLSNIPEPFCSKIKEYGSHTREFVTAFKQTIDQYEKSMGKTSQRGGVRSAPRKVKWAFDAADDLDKFRQSLSAQLHLVHITISTSILQTLPGTLSSQALGRRAHPAGRLQGHLDWNYNPVDGLNFLNMVDDITDLVYERLLTAPSMPLASQRRIPTLPDNVSISVPQSQPNTSAEGLGLPSTNYSDNDPVPNQEREPADVQPQPRHQNTLAAEINEYLHSLNLEQLSLEEVEMLNQAHNSSQRRLLLGSEEPSPESELQGAKVPSYRAQTPPDETKRFDTLGLTASIVGFISSASRLAFEASAIYKSVVGAPRELRTLSNRIMQYTSLLRIAANIIRDSIPDENLQMVGLQVLRDGEEAFEGIRHVLAKYNPKTGTQRRAKAVVLVMKWSSDRKRIFAIMDEIESLKSTLTIMLQTHQSQMTERTLEAMKFATEQASVSHQR